MFTYPFMRDAFIASFFISILCGVIGVFVISRRMAFFAHTLSEIGFSGAAFGILVGVSPIVGMLLFTILSSLLIGAASSQTDHREASISVFSGLFIGLGILFLALAKTQASYATNILFGSIVGIDAGNVRTLVVLSLVILLILFLVYRSLKYDSFDKLGAKVNTHRSLWISILFLVVLACTVSVTAQIIGSLLIFVLLTIPASASRYFVHTVAGMITLSFLFALFGTWFGLYLSYLTNWPVSAFVAILESLIYGVALIYHHVSEM